MLLNSLPSPSNDTLVLVCGPPGLVTAVAGEKPNMMRQVRLVLCCADSTHLNNA